MKDYRFNLVCIVAWCCLLGAAAVRAATQGVIVNTTAPMTPGAIPYAATSTRIQPSPIQRLSATTIAVTNVVVGGNLTRGMTVLTGTNTTINWAASDRYVWTLSASSTNTHINVPTGAGTVQYVSLTVTSDGGSKTVDFVFPGGVTTNWISNFVRVPRIGQTEFGFYHRGTTMDIWAWPDSFPDGNGNVYRQASGTNGFGQLSLSSANAVTGALGVANGGTGAATATANTIFSGPTSGGAAAPAFRVLVAADIPGGVGGTAGTVINAGASATGAVPRYTNTTGTNVAPSVVIVDGSGNVTGVNSLTTTTLSAGTLTVTNKLARSLITNATPYAVVINDATGMLTNIPLPGIAGNWTFYSGGTTNNPPGWLEAPAGSTGTAGTMINTGANAVGTVPRASDTSNTNYVPSSLIIGSSTNLSVPGEITTYQVTATNRYLLPDGTALLPAMEFKSDADGTGLGLYRAGANQLGFSMDGVSAMILRGSEMKITGRFAFGLTTGSDDAFISRESAAVIQLGNDDVPGASQLFKGPDGLGADGAAGKIMVAGGRPTGMGAGGDTGFQTAPSAKSTGSSAQTLLDRFRVVAKGKVLTDGAAVSLFEVALPTLKTCGGRIMATISCTDGTDVQTFSQEVVFSAVNKAAAYTSEILPVPMDLVSKSGTKAVSAGTLTTTWTVLTGTDKVTIQLNADTSLTPSSNAFTVYYQLFNNSEQAITVL